MTSHGVTSRLDVAVGHVVTLDGLEAELTEVEARATLGRTGPLGVVLLAVLDATGHQHGSGLPRGRSGRGSGSCLGCLGLGGLGGTVGAVRAVTARATTRTVRTTTAGATARSTGTGGSLRQIGRAHV